MTRDKAIWMGIRTLGLVIVPQGGIAIVRLLNYGVAMFTMEAIGFTPRILTTHWSLGVIKQCVVIWVMIYLLRYGASLHGLIARKCVVSNKPEKEVDVISIVVIRTIGAWFLLRGLLEAISLVLTSLNHLLFHGYKIASDNGVEESGDGGRFVCDFVLSAEFAETLCAVIAFGVIGCYLLNRGAFFIDFIKAKRKVRSANTGGN